MNNKKTIAVFGGTGNLGTHFVQLALDAGYSLRVLVRNKSKFTNAEHPNVNAK